MFNEPSRRDASSGASDDDLREFHLALTRIELICNIIKISSATVVLRQRPRTPSWRTCFR